MDISVLRKWPILLGATLLAAGPVSLSQAANVNPALTVEDAASPVKVRSSQRWHTPEIGMSMSMPSVASTGANGAIRMSHLESMISVAANTTVEILEGPVPGLPMQRVIQERGNAFYDIAPRGDNKLRVEAAYLVAVVKGTQFNVTVDEDMTTIALFEGELQVEAPGVGDVIDLYAGQVARIHRDDQQISIIDMVSGELVARADSASGSRSGSLASLGADDGAAGLVSSFGGGTTTTIGNTGLSTGLAANLDLGNGKLGIASDVDLGLGGRDLGAGVAASADLGTGEIDLGIDAGAIEIGADLDLGLDSGVGETLADVIDDLLDDTDTTVEEVVDPLPDLGDLIGI